MTNGSRRLDWAVLLVVWAIATLVNLAKPYHIDDTAGLLIAEAISRAPFHPMGEMLNWLNTAEPIFVTNQPHLFFYLTAATVELFGNSELVLHLLLAAFSLLAIAAFYLLLRRFAPEHALWASCASVLGPGFLINQNAMTDVPLLALLCVAMLLVTGPKGRGVGGGFAVFGLAVLTKYTALFLLPAMIWGTLARVRNLIWIGLPVVALSGWSLFNYWDYGALHILNRPANVGGMMPSPRLAFAVVCNLGLFAVPVAAVLMAQNLHWAAVFALGIAVFYASEIVGLGNAFQHFMAPNAALFASAFLVLIVAAKRTIGLFHALLRVPNKPWKSPEFLEISLAVWLLGGIGFLATFPPFMASRHALLLMPPLVILGLAGQAKIQSPTRWVPVAVIWLSIGLFVAANDIAFARFYRDSAPIMAQKAEDVANGADVYSRGHWGWQWYARKAGMLEYDSARTEMEIGDILVDPVGISSQHVMNLMDYTVLETQVQRTGPFTFLDTHRFYASGALPLPVFAPGEERQIRILRKTR